MSAILITVAAVAGLSAFFVRAVQVWACRRALLDLPNDRSSHTLPVPRLGGAAAVPIVLVAIVVLGMREQADARTTGMLLAAAAVLYLLGLCDDLRPLSSTLRLGIQATVASVFVFFAARLVPGVLEWKGLPAFPIGVLLLVWIVGFLNIYNFMDGIDGLAGTQAIVAGVAWFIVGLPHGATLTWAAGVCLAAGAAGFLCLNWPPARIFMGDAGSTVIGFLLAVLPLVAAIESKAAVASSLYLLTGILCVWPFVADGSFTIARRLCRGENILKAHRSHLYQRLVISGVSHRTVTLYYGAGAAVMAALAIFALRRGGGAAWFFSGGVGLLQFAVVWCWTVRRERFRET